MFKTTSYSIEDTRKFAELVLEQVFKDREKTAEAQNSAAVLVLKGDLGSGKTAFSKCVGKILGIEEEITSPTFSIEKRYKISNKKDDGYSGFSGIETLIHIDAFRLESGNEILGIDFAKTLANPKNLICFEWPEMVADIDVLPKDAPVVEFEFVDENTRNLYFSPTSESQY